MAAQEITHDRDVRVEDLRAGGCVAVHRQRAGGPADLRRDLAAIAGGRRGLRGPTAGGAVETGGDDKASIRTVSSAICFCSVASWSAVARLRRSSSPQRPGRRPGAARHKKRKVVTQRHFDTHGTLARQLGHETGRASARRCARGARGALGRRRSFGTEGEARRLGIGGASSAPRPRPAEGRGPEASARLGADGHRVGDAGPAVAWRLQVAVEVVVEDGARGRERGVDAACRRRRGAGLAAHGGSHRQYTPTPARDPRRYPAMPASTMVASVL